MLFTCILCILCTFSTGEIVGTSVSTGGCVTGTSVGVRVNHGPGRPWPTPRVGHCKTRKRGSATVKGGRATPHGPAKTARRAIFFELWFKARDFLTRNRIVGLLFEKNMFGGTVSVIIFRIMLGEILV